MKYKLKKKIQNNEIINLADSIEDILNINNLDNKNNIKVFVLSYSTNNSLILLSEEKLIKIFIEYKSL